jgi:hypothetical protein
MKITKKTLLTRSLLMLSCFQMTSVMASDPYGSGWYGGVGGAGAPASRSGAGAHSSEEDVDIDQLMKDIMIAEKSVCRRSQEIDPLGKKTKVIVLGVTGAGKSTVLHALAGKKLMVKKGESKIEIHVPEDQKLGELSVGHMYRSETTLPVSWQEERGLFYWDCPGFMDTRGAAQDIINAFAVDSLFSPPTRIKTLLIMQESEITSRGGGAFDRFHKLAQLLTNFDQLKQSLSLVVTKGGEDGYTPQQILGGVKGREHPLLAFFIANPDRVFSFPKPPSSADGHEYTLFEDRDRLIRALKSPPVVNPAHSISLDDKAIVHVVGMMQKLDDIGELLRNFSSSMQDEYRTKELEALRKWEVFVRELTALRDDDMGKPDKLADILQHSIPSNPAKFQEILERISSTRRISTFLEKLCASNLEGAVDMKGIPEILRPLLRNMAAELHELVENKTLIEEQKQKTQAIAEELERQRIEAEQKEQEQKRKLEESEARSKEKTDKLQRQVDAEAEAARIAREEGEKRIKEYEQKSAKEAAKLQAKLEEEVKAGKIAREEADRRAVAYQKEAAEEAAKLQARVEEEAKAGRAAREEAERQLLDYQRRSAEDIRKSNEEYERRMEELRSKMEREEARAARAVEEMKHALDEKDRQTNEKIRGIEESSRRTLEDMKKQSDEQLAKMRGQAEEKVKKKRWGFGVLPDGRIVRYELPN